MASASLARKCALVRAFFRSERIIGRNTVVVKNIFKHLFLRYVWVFLLIFSLWEIKYSIFLCSLISPSIAHCCRGIFFSSEVNNELHFCPSCLVLFLYVRKNGMAHKYNASTALCSKTKTDLTKNHRECRRKMGWIKLNLEGRRGTKSAFFSESFFSH